MGKSIDFFMNEHVWSPTDVFISGVEDMVKRVAEEYYKDGHKVTVYYNGHSIHHNGVNYCNRRSFDTEQRRRVLIIVQEAGLLDLPLAASKILYWTAETDAKEKLTPDRLAKVNQIIGLSDYFKTMLNDEQAAKTTTVYLAPTINWLPDVTKYKNHAIYASAPERGLKQLLLNWKLFKNTVLHVTYGIDRLPADEMYEYMSLLEQPNVIYEGSVSNNELERIFNQCSLWLYPCIGNELYCITGQNAIRAGCVPIYYPYMALAETVRYGIAVRDISQMAICANNLIKDKEAMTYQYSDVIKAPVRSWFDVARDIALLW